MWIGLSLETKANAKMQTLIEGIALRAAEVLTAMDAHVLLTGALSINGGMSVNPYFCQFLADLIEGDVSVPQFGELTAVGTALLAGQDRSRPAPGYSEKLVYHPKRHDKNWRLKFDDAVGRSRSWSKNG